VIDNGLKHIVTLEKILFKDVFDAVIEVERESTSALAAVI